MTQLHKKEQELIDEILTEFNFAKCKVVMDHLNWCWGLNGQVPSIQQLKEFAKDRIDSAIEGLKKSKKWSHHQPYMSSSGGLCVNVWKNRYGYICDIKLEFILTEWATY